MKRADLGSRNTAPRKKLSRAEIWKLEYERQAHCWQDWKTETRRHVLRASAYLCRTAKTARKMHCESETESLTFAAAMIEAVFQYDAPGLFCGMYYSRDWKEFHAGGHT